MERQGMLQIRPLGRKSTYGAVMWGLLPAYMVFAGGILAYKSSCGSQAPEIFWPFLLGTLSFCCMAAGKLLERKNLQFRLLGLIPWILLLMLSGIECLSEQVTWLNVLISRWNQIHDAGLVLLNAGSSGTGLESAAMLMAVFQAELVWILIYGGHNLALGMYGLFWTFLLLMEMAFSPMACALLLSGLLGSCMAGEHRDVSVRVRLWMLGTAAVLCMCALVIPGKELAEIRTTREAMAREIHTLRYGEEFLPEGNLREAGKLLAADETMMKIQSEQAKDLYLKGFVGGILEDGEWNSLHDADYGGEDTGILKWLSEHKFDPLTQSSLYYTLGEEKDCPEINGLFIHMIKGNRYYFYVPGSLQNVILGESREERDQNLLSQGMIGQRQYKVEELSGFQPSELQIVDEWVRNPQNEEQMQYSEAEAVYRDFVYRHYTTVDDGLSELMQEWFWDDYETESDGIYSAVSYVRQKLTDGVSYTVSPQAAPQGENPVRWFLMEGKEGNAVQYATAAVEAFRSHGIPARYVEGYFVPASLLVNSQNGQVDVTGKQAHAWTEVYFDGIGWLTIDVTPGYYYDALKLQQMVGMPDAVHKTAALEDSELGADEINDRNSEGGRETEQEPSVMLSHRVLVLGVLAILLIIYTVLWSAGEIYRGFRLWRLGKKINEAEGTERIVQVEQLMFSLLKLLGIDASLGWGTIEIDQTLAEQYEEIEQGEYSRVCQLIERSVYGGCALAVFEERTLYSFLDKLALLAKKKGWTESLQIRYLMFR